MLFRSNFFVSQSRYATGEEGAIVKREWWVMWEKDDPPKCEFVIQSWDTAFTKSERSDYSACTTWGVFYKDEDKKDAHIILLDSFQKRMEFPELKEKAPSEPEVYLIIEEFWKKYEYGPSLREIAYLRGKVGLGNTKRIVDDKIPASEPLCVHGATRTIR